MLSSLMRMSLAALRSSQWASTSAHSFTPFDRSGSRGPCLDRSRISRRYRRARPALRPQSGSVGQPSRCDASPTMHECLRFDNGLWELAIFGLEGRTVADLALDLHSAEADRGDSATLTPFLAHGICAVKSRRVVNPMF